MSSIDQVIARSRQPGGFKERKRFTVARQRAIRKMRQFALADPHYYVLELIQAAVANHATHVDLRIEKKNFGMSYIGGGFTQEELAQLFDFLFASKEDFEHGDIRQLALGINALMIMEPKRIIIESGDGTMGGTTRIEIKSSENTVDVGTPDAALRGTFVRAEGLRRGKIRGKSNLLPTDYGPRECMAIENRCLAAPVPILVNDEPVFGYSSVRTPVIFGYRNVVTFDEGDLYGSIGIAEQRHKEIFKLLTWGSWIQSLEHSLVSGARLGGVVAYDRLNKTADHSGIVKDATLHEMWARLKPYAHKALSGETGKAVFQISPLGGDLLEPRELREMLQEHGTAVVVPPMLSPGGQAGERAQEIGRVLDAPVLKVDDKEMPTLRNLAGKDVRLIRPDLTNPGELAFFKKPTAKAPARPWLIGATELSPISLGNFVAHLFHEEIVPSDEKAIETILSRLGGRPADAEKIVIYADELRQGMTSTETSLVDQLQSTSEITGTIYTPDDVDVAGASRRELWVRVRSVDRVVWQGAVTSAYPGHVLDIEVPSASPSALLEPVTKETDASLAWLIAEVMARYAIDDLEKTAKRTLDSLGQFDIEPGSTGARVALAALSRDAVKRLRSSGSSGAGADDGGPSVRFSLVGNEASLDLLDVPVFRTLDGTPTTMRDLAWMLEQTAGLVYGVIPEVTPDLEGLDQSQILELDLETERLLMQIVGEGAYVRVDKRDVLAADDASGWKVRDIALGLRDYPSGPLLAEGGEGTPDESTIEALVQQLIRQFGGVGVRGDDEELRRQAVRHLQFFVGSRLLKAPEMPTYGVETMGLFLDGHGRVVSLQDIRRGFATHGRMVMVDGRSSDVCEMGSLSGRKTEASDTPPNSLMMNSWVFGLLQPFGELSGAFDFDLTDAEAADVEVTPETAFVASTEIEGENMSGRVGLPEAPVENPSIAVISADNQQVFQLRQPAIEHGIVGLIKVESGGVEARWKEVYSAARHAGWRVLSSLTEGLAERQDDDDYERILAQLFDFAARHMRLAKRPDGTVFYENNHGLAQRILDIPLFSTTRGIPVSAQRLINEFCVEQTRGRSLHDSTRIVLTEDVPPVLVDWVERHLCPENVARPPAHSAQHLAVELAVEREDAADPVAADGGGSLNTRTLGKLLERLLRELRPDDYALELAKRHEKFDQDDQTLEQEVERFHLRVWVLDFAAQKKKRTVPSDRVYYLLEATDDEDAFVYANGRPPVLLVNSQHGLAQRAVAAGATDSRALAWLLLGAYSHVNALLEPVTNEHELAFQRRVADALEKGQLGVG